MEFWTQFGAAPKLIGEIAGRVEAEGWDGLTVTDSQNLWGDPFIGLTLAAQVTERIGLGTAVSNPVTRLAAAAASSIATVDIISGERFTYGIGRGDSALAHLGRSPARLAYFERYLGQMRGYLSDGEVSFDDIDIPLEIAPHLAELELASAPPNSRLRIMQGRRRIPIEVAATGPKVISIAAVNSDRVMFALGAEPERIAWGIEIAKSARREKRLDPDAIKFGAYVNSICHPDLPTAREMVKGGLTTFARFAVMHGTVTGPSSESLDASLQSLRGVYDMKTHTQSQSAQADTLTPDFIDSYAIVGTPVECTKRFQDLADLGLDKVIISGNLYVSQTDAGRDAQALMASDVLPHFR